MSCVRVRQGGGGGQIIEPHSFIFLPLTMCFSFPCLRPLSLIRPPPPLPSLAFFSAVILPMYCGWLMGLQLSIIRVEGKTNWELEEKQANGIKWERQRKYKKGSVREAILTEIWHLFVTD